MECRGLEPIKWHPTGAHAERLITRIRFGREAGLYSAVVAAFGAPALTDTAATPWHWCARTVGPYEAESESGVVFDGVRLDEGDDWCDYDEKAEASMTVGREVRYEFRRQ